MLSWHRPTLNEARTCLSALIGSMRMLVLYAAGSSTAGLPRTQFVLCLTKPIRRSFLDFSGTGHMPGKLILIGQYASSKKCRGPRGFLKMAASSLSAFYRKQD